ncbi:glycine zipper family protein [Paraburkholderia silviterrae]
MIKRRRLMQVMQAAFALATVTAACVTHNAHAQVIYSKPVVYPARGQTPYQQSTDDGACYSWARQQTGFDPAWAATAPAPAWAPGGQRVVGAARGAATGAVAGAIAGDAGKGAAAGAAIGTMVGGIEHRQARRAAGAYNAQAQMNSEAGASSYSRAWSACMAGRGYTVN